MNTDHPAARASGVLRLLAITTLFAIACGFPDSLNALLAALQPLFAG